MSLGSFLNLQPFALGKVFDQAYDPMSTSRGAGRPFRLSIDGSATNELTTAQFASFLAQLGPEFTAETFRPDGRCKDYDYRMGIWSNRWRLPKDLDPPVGHPLEPPTNPTEFTTTSEPANPPTHGAESAGDLTECPNDVPELFHLLFESAGRVRKKKWYHGIMPAFEIWSRVDRGTQQPVFLVLAVSRQPETDYLWSPPVALAHQKVQHSIDCSMGVKFLWLREKSVADQQTIRKLGLWMMAMGLVNPLERNWFWETCVSESTRRRWENKVHLTESLTQFITRCLPGYRVVRGSGPKDGELETKCIFTHDAVNRDFVSLTSIAPWAIAAWNEAKYIQFETSFKGFPFVYCVPQAIIRNEPVPLGFIVARHECHLIYNWFCSDLANSDKTKTVLRKVILSDEGTGLHRFCEKSTHSRRLVHFFCHHHLMQAFADSPILGELVTQALATESEEIYKQLRPTFLRLAWAAWKEKKITRKARMAFEAFCSARFPHGIWHRAPFGVARCTYHTHRFYAVINARIEKCRAPARRFFEIYRYIMEEGGRYGVPETLRRNIERLYGYGEFRPGDCQFEECKAYRVNMNDRFEIPNYPCRHNVEEWPIYVQHNPIPPLPVLECSSLPPRLVFEATDLGWIKTQSKRSKRFLRRKALQVVSSASPVDEDEANSNDVERVPWGCEDFTDYFAGRRIVMSARNLIRQRGRAVDIVVLSFWILRGWNAGLNRHIREHAADAVAQEWADRFTLWCWDWAQNGDLGRAPPLMPFAPPGDASDPPDDNDELGEDPRAVEHLPEEPKPYPALPDRSEPRTEECLPEDEEEEEVSEAEEFPEEEDLPEVRVVGEEDPPPQGDGSEPGFGDEEGLPEPMALPQSLSGGGDVAESEPPVFVTVLGEERDGEEYDDLPEDAGVPAPQTPAHDGPAIPDGITDASLLPNSRSWAERVISTSPLLAMDEGSIGSRVAVELVGEPQATHRGGANNGCRRTGSKTRGVRPPPPRPGRLDSSVGESVPSNSPHRRNPSRGSTRTAPLPDLPVPDVNTPYQPSPLRNFGATCYVNAVLQCLFGIPRLRNFFHSRTTRDFLTTSVPKLACLFTTLLLQLNATTDAAVDAREQTLQQFPSALGTAVDVTFTPVLAEDAGDFLRALLDGLDAELRPISLKGSLGFDPFPFKTGGVVGPQTIMAHLFGGVFSQQRICKLGHLAVPVDVPFVILDLHFHGTQPTSVRQLLSEFVNEPINGAENPLCDTCDANVPVERRAPISRAPDVLIIRIARFELREDNRFIFGQQVFRTFRINTPVLVQQDLPLGTFNGFLDPPNNPLQVTYELISCVDHFPRGFTGADDGHFIAHVRVRTGGETTWYRCDDQLIETEPSVPHFSDASPAVYILFYERQSI
jgi:ubiquitin C-terminal hydrolase